MGKNKHRQASTPESKKQAAVWCAIAIIAITVMVLVANPSETADVRDVHAAIQPIHTDTIPQTEQEKEDDENRPAPCNSRHNPCSSATRNRSPTTCATC